MKKKKDGKKKEYKKPRLVKHGKLTDIMAY